MNITNGVTQSKGRDVSIALWDCASKLSITIIQCSQLKILQVNKKSSMVCYKVDVTPQFL